MNLCGMDFRVVIFMGMLNWALKGLSGFRPVECTGYSFKGLGNGLRKGTLRNMHGGPGSGKVSIFGPQGTQG